MTQGLMVVLKAKLHVHNSFPVIAYPDTLGDKGNGGYRRRWVVRAGAGRQKDP